MSVPLRCTGGSSAGVRGTCTASSCPPARRDAVAIARARRIARLAAGIRRPRMQRGAQLDDHAPARAVRAAAGRRARACPVRPARKLQRRERGNAQQMVDVGVAHVRPIASRPPRGSPLRARVARNAPRGSTRGSRRGPRPAGVLRSSHHALAESRHELGEHGARRRHASSGRSRSASSSHVCTAASRIAASNSTAPVFGAVYRRSHPAEQRAACCEHAAVRDRRRRAAPTRRAASRKIGHEVVGARAARIRLEAAHVVDRDRAVGAQQRVDAQRAPRIVVPAEPDRRRARIDRLLVGRREKSLRGIDGLRPLRDGSVALPVARARRCRRAARLPLPSPGRTGKRPVERMAMWPAAIGGEHVLRGRPVVRRHRRPGTRQPTARARPRGSRRALAPRLEHRPAHREPAPAHALHRTAMREVHRVRGDRLAVLAAVRLRRAARAAATRRRRDDAWARRQSSTSSA